MQIPPLAVLDQMASSAPCGSLGFQVSSASSNSSVQPYPPTLSDWPVNNNNEAPGGCKLKAEPRAPPSFLLPSLSVSASIQAFNLKSPEPHVKGGCLMLLCEVWRK